MAIPVILLAKIASILTSISEIKNLFQKEEVKAMKNWRTTLIGMLLAIGTVVQDSMQQGTFSWRAVLPAALMAALGYAAKDAGVSGTEK